jgi:hypothetical protein
MSISLLEAARGMSVSRDRAIIEIYARESQVLSTAPVLQTGPVHLWKVEDALPYATAATGTRAINSDFTASQGRSKAYEGKVKVYGGKIQVDRYISHNYPQSVVFDEMMQVKALSRQLTWDVFEGSGGQYLRGVWDWCTYDSAYSGQVVQSGATTTPVVITTDMLDELLSKINIVPGKTFIYMNDYPCRKILKDTKNSEYIGLSASYTPDNLNGFAGVYSGFGPAVPIICMKDGKGTDILSTTQADYSSSGSTSQSVYAVTWGDQMASLFSSNGNTIPVIQRKSDGTNYEYEVLEWFVGFAPQMPRAIGVLKSIKNALS